ncbi:hypothetical protein QE152_g1718 [Popillia japonica]|uniref:Uncharacterized protein n=1 Tax=Popillia japonica TaxID=7064 RepID=A0AAW1N1R1_POPJA
MKPLPNLIRKYQEHRKFQKLHKKSQITYKPKPKSTYSTNLNLTKPEVVATTESQPIKPTQEEPNSSKQGPQPQIEQFLEFGQPKSKELEPK